MSAQANSATIDLHQQATPLEGADTHRFWLTLLGIILLSAVLRVMFFQGMGGGDDFVYFLRASQIAHGVWASSDYIGAIRYGTNIPIAVAIGLFGTNLYSGALVPLACSLGEIAIVSIITRSGLGQRAALYAALTLCFVPLQINSASNIHADPILAFTITATFALFWIAEQEANPWYYLAAGLSAGYAYWVKEASVLFILSFGLYIVVVRRWSWQWLYSGLGALLAFTANAILMWAVTGHPFHNLAVMRSMAATEWVAPGRADSPFYYFKYLLFDIRHTWILGYLAIIGLVYMLIQRRTMTRVQRSFATYVVVWAAGLLLAFSIVPVSIAPLRFVMKQTNYMTIFLAPLAILGGFGLVQMRAQLRAGAMLLLAVGAFMIAALTQQDMRVFAANAQTASTLVQLYPNDLIFGNWWVSAISRFHGQLKWPNTDRFIRKLTDLPPVVHTAPGQKVLIVVDHETYGQPIKSVDPPNLPSCWTQIDTLKPQGFGIGAGVTRVLIGSLELLPNDIEAPLTRPLRKLLHPAAAEVYMVPPLDPWCENSVAK